MIKSGAPCRLTVVTALELMVRPATAVLSQVKEAPPEAVKVSVTGPAATRAWAWKGIATEAPGVVFTLAGRLRAALAPLTLACVGAVMDSAKQETKTLWNTLTSLRTYLN